MDNMQGSDLSISDETRQTLWLHDSLGGKQSPPDQGLLEIDLEPRRIQKHQ